MCGDKISVIVPVYNAEKYLNRCIESILNQTYSNLEIILVDDGSPDNCPFICDNYALKDNRVKVIHQKNAGVAAARNAGLVAATGEYITFVDSDDYIDSIMYQKMLEVSQLYDCDLIMCDCIKEFENYSELYTHNIRTGFYNEKQLHEEYYPHLLIMPNMEYPATISNWVCLFRNKQNNNVRYKEGIRFSEDWLFGAQLMLQSKSFYYMKGKAYYHYQMNNQSATHTFTQDKWNDYCKLHIGMQKIFLNVESFNFEEQIDKVLLFLVYNSVGDLLGAKQLSRSDRKKAIKNILKEPEVRKMFKRIQIGKLEISKKLKLLTLIYKVNLGISLLCCYYER